MKRKAFFSLLSFVSFSPSLSHRFFFPVALKPEREFSLELLLFFCFCVLQLTPPPLSLSLLLGKKMKKQTNKNTSSFVRSRCPFLLSLALNHPSSLFHSFSLPPPTPLLTPHKPSG